MRSDVRHLVVVGAVASVAALSWSLVSAADFTVETKLTAPDGAAEDHFGISVAVSGDTVVVGALGTRQSVATGWAEVFEAATGVFVD